MMIHMCYNCRAEYSSQLPYCSRCGQLDTIVAIANRSMDNLWRTEEGVALSAAEIVKRRHRKKLASASYPKLAFDRESLIAVYGNPGGGKSTFALRLIDGVDGPSMYLCFEEPADSVTVADRVRRLEIIREDIVFASPDTPKSVEELVERYRPGFVVVDSLSETSLTIDDLKRISRFYGICVIFILHVTTDGTAKGGTRGIHMADLVVRVSDLEWEIEKSRYSARVRGAVL